MKQGVDEAITWWIEDVRDKPEGANPHTSTTEINGQLYHRVDNGQYVPEFIYRRIAQGSGTDTLPTTGTAVYRRYVELEYLPDQIVIPVFLCIFVLVLYVLGKFVAARVASLFEWAMQRLPLVRNVYASVKQVTDFMFRQAELRYTKVVAIEYPRPGIWAVGFVTGEGIEQVNSKIGEPCLTVVCPGSPMPVTGYAVTVAKSSAIELDITIDQALQYFVSCGVVVPPLQRASVASVAATGTLPQIALPTGGVRPRRTRRASGARAAFHFLEPSGTTCSCYFVEAMGFPAPRH